MVFRPQPAPDDIVWVYNTVFERQRDGTWLGWLEELGAEVVTLGRAARAPRLFEVRCGDATDCKVALGGKISLHLVALEDDELERFQARYAMRFAKRDVPDTPWPPPSGFQRNLEFAPGGKI